MSEVNINFVKYRTFGLVWLECNRPDFNSTGLVICKRWYFIQTFENSMWMNMSIFFFFFKNNLPAIHIPFFVFYLYVLYPLQTKFCGGSIEITLFVWMPRKHNSLSGMSWYWWNFTQLQYTPWGCAWRKIIPFQNISMEILQGR